ncbi:MAG: universal stress protein [Halobacteriota archaeon]
MHFVVAYDGTPITDAALARARTVAEGVDGAVTAVTILPQGNTAYARERGWIGDDEPWERDSILDGLRNSVDSVAPSATFVFRMVDRYAPRGKIGRVLRTTAETADVDVLVIGTENAGRVFTTLTTVTQSVANGTYDLHVVRSVPSLSG